MNQNITNYLKFIVQVAEIALVWVVSCFLLEKMLLFIGYGAGQAALPLALILVTLVYGAAAILDTYLEKTEVMRNAEVFIQNNRDDIFKSIKRIFTWIINAQTCFLMGSIASFIFYLIIKYKRRK